MRNAVTAAIQSPSRWLVIVYLAGLMLVHAIPYAWATITLDTARDLHAALLISQGDIVARGPILNGAIHLGPVWFYLLAPVLALTGSQALTLLWAGLLAAVKFPLAYSLGRTAGLPAAGLLLAAMLALPGWANVGAMLPTHTVLVEAMTLAQLLLLFRLAGGSANRDWAILGIIAGVAAHAHPSACFILLPAPIIWLWRRREHGLQLRWIIVGVVLAILPLAPALMADAATGWTQATSAISSAGRSADWPRPFAVFAILRGTFIGGPFAGLAPVESTVTQGIALGMIAMLWLAGAISLLRSHQLRDRAVLAPLAALTLAVAVILALVRDYTPYYMALVLLPPGFTIIAIGLARLPQWRWFLAVAALPAIIGSHSLVIAAQRGQATLEVARQADLRRPNQPTKAVALLSAWQLDAIGRAGCEAPDRPVLHGSLALLSFGSLELAPEIACGAREAFVFSGPGDRNSEHWLGLPPRLARRLGWQSDTSWLSTPRIGVLALWPPDPLPQADRQHYPFFATAKLPSEEIDINVETPGGFALITTNLLYPYRSNRVLSVSANGSPARQQARLDVTTVWVCDVCSEPAIRWAIRLNSNSPDSFEAVGIKLPSER